MSPSLFGTALITSLLLYTASRLLLIRRPITAADTTVHSLDWLTRTTVHKPLLLEEPAIVPDGWQSQTVFDLASAEELLNQLEVAGYDERSLCVLGNSTFEVRWR